MDEVVIGMAHRGRLNVLANIVGKPYSQIFREFEGNMDPGQTHGSGDVKYHLGAEGKYIRPFGDGQVDVTLVANPSHLEVVDPVLEGVVRAKQDLLDLGEQGYTVMPLRCTATPRSPVRAWSPRRSTCRCCAATAPAAPCT